MLWKGEEIVLEATGNVRLAFGVRLDEGRDLTALSGRTAKDPTLLLPAGDRLIQNHRWQSQRQLLFGVVHQAEVQTFAGRVGKALETEGVSPDPIVQWIRKLRACWREVRSGRLSGAGGLNQCEAAHDDRHAEPQPRKIPRMPGTQRRVLLHRSFLARRSARCP